MNSKNLGVTSFQCFCIVIGNPLIYFRCKFLSMGKIYFYPWVFNNIDTVHPTDIKFLSVVVHWRSYFNCFYEEIEIRTDK